MKARSTTGQTQRQKRGIWLTVIACLAFMSILWILFYNKITTPRYLSMIELRVNGLVLLKQPKSLSEIKAKAIAAELPSDKWQLLAVQNGRCDAICVESMTSLVIMLDQLKQAHFDKTQLMLVADDTAELLTVINGADQNNRISREKIQIIALDGSQQQSVEDAINRVTNMTTTLWPKVIIIDDSHRYRGYFTSPFDANKLLLTYSSVIEHR